MAKSVHAEPSPRLARNYRSALAKGPLSFSGWEPKRLFHQLDSGAFEECAYADGFDSRADGRALIAVDLDGDGDQDLVMVNRNEPRIQLFRNDGATGNSLELSLRATHGNLEAAGAVVHVQSDGHVRAFPVVLQRGFQSSVDPGVHVGLGAEQAAEIVVTWRRGATERFGVVKSGARYTLVEGEGHPGPPKPFAAKRPVPDRDDAYPSQIARLGFDSDPRPTIVQVFASGCKACATEVPTLVALQDRYRVVGLGAHSAEELPAVVARLRIPYPTRPLSEALDAALSVRGQLSLPTTLVYRSDGTLFRVAQGAEALADVLGELSRSAN